MKNSKFKIRDLIVFDHSKLNHNDERLITAISLLENKYGFVYPISYIHPGYEAVNFSTVDLNINYNYGTKPINHNWGIGWFKKVSEPRITGVRFKIANRVYLGPYKNHSIYYLSSHKVLYLTKKFYSRFDFIEESLEFGHSTFKKGMKPWLLQGVRIMAMMGIVENNFAKKILNFH